MKWAFFCAFSALLLAMTMQAASATPRHPGSGVYRGPAYAWGGYYGYPVAGYGWRSGYWSPGFGMPDTDALPFPAGYPLASIPLVINATPIAQPYIQQEPIVEATIQPAPEVNFWHYCTQPPGYFPYVQNCSQPWIKVTPQSPASPQ